MPDDATVKSQTNVDDTVNDHERKRAYLALLPSEQIIDLCLAFEQHVSLAVKSTLWPADLDAAILALKTSHTEAAPQILAGALPSVSASIPQAGPSSAANVTSEQVHPPGGAFESPLAPLDQSFPSHVPPAGPPVAGETQIGRAHV